MDNKPASRKIAEAIEEMIRMGVYPEDSPLPSEFELCEKYGVSRVTVQKALAGLVADNFVYSVSGKGHYVKSDNRDVYRFFYEEFAGCEIRVLNVSISRPTMDVVYNLQVAPDEHVVRIQRLAQKGGRTVAYDEKYISYYPGVPIIEAEIDFSDFTALVSNIASGYEIGREMVVRAVKGNEEVWGHLGVEKGTELILVEQRLLSSDNICLGWGRTYFLPGEFEITAVQE